MKQEEKELLLKDLCARLPYKTYVKTTKGIGYVYAINTSQLVELSVANNSEYWSEVFNIDDIKPYLRPMSSMTEEETIEFINLTDSIIKFVNKHYAVLSLQQIDWLNAHHFDYQELIPKGLAIEVTKDNNPYEKQYS